MPPSDDWYALVEEQIKTLQRQFTILSDKLDENTQSTKNVETNTAGVVAAFKAAEGAFRVLETLGKIAKPFMWLSLAAGSTGVVLSNWWQQIKTYIPWLSR